MTTSLFLRCSVLLFALVASCGAEVVQIRSGGASVAKKLNSSLFTGASGWTLELDLTGTKITAGETLLSLLGSNQGAWLTASVSQEGTLLAFALRTDYNAQPLIVAVPLSILHKASKPVLVLRYKKNSLDLYLQGVLVDQEWPIGALPLGPETALSLGENHAGVRVTDNPVPDQTLLLQNGGAKAVAAREDFLLGPDFATAQYGRPRGWNTNAGDAMPWFHDGTFHLYFLIDRRQHHSKWRLGAHQWYHISSTDLIHWTHYPVALGIDHDWEGSICTGSVFFNGGVYYAFYATRMQDRSEHLAMAEGNDPVHFRKLIPTPFAEPQPPFVHGPNRDPFVFQADGKFHMLVTAAVPAADGKTHGALEHLTSADLKQWTPDPKPFLLIPTTEQPECSDLFQWGDWYYLIYSLSGVTHYKVSKTPLGSWSTPENEVLDGPEAIVMKAAPFKNGRFLSVGFLQHDNMYGGDLVFRELTQQSDGSLGTRFPAEMIPKGSGAAEHPQDLRVRSDTPSRDLPLQENSMIRATITPSTNARYAIALKAQDGTVQKLLFDSVAKTVSWSAASDGKPGRTMIRGVTDLAKPFQFTLVLHGTIADLMISGDRTVVHRLNASSRSFAVMVESGEVEVTSITESPTQ